MGRKTKCTAEENINTMDMNGELLLTIMSSLVHQEVESLSPNVKLGLKHLKNDLVLDLHKSIDKRTILESNIGEQKNISKRMARLRKK